MSSRALVANSLAGLICSLWEFALLGPKLHHCHGRRGWIRIRGRRAVMAPSTGTSGLSVDGWGNLYFSEWGANLINKVTPGAAEYFHRLPETPQNTGGGYYGDGGAAVGAGLNNPSGTAWDAAGNLYIRRLRQQSRPQGIDRRYRPYRGRRRQ